MKSVDTGCKTIFRFDHVLSDSTCDRIVSFINEIKGEKTINNDSMPWDENDSFNWADIPSDYLFAKIESYRELVTSLVSNCYNEEVYPHFTDIVLWRKGRHMNRHRDDGWTDAEVYMRQRAYTTITYLNDNFTGGETFIASENGDYLNKPKKGSVVILKSTPENAHGVNAITSGYRITLPIWFTRNYDNREIYNGR